MTNPYNGMSAKIISGCKRLSLSTRTILIGKYQQYFFIWDRAFYENIIYRLTNQRFISATIFLLEKKRNKRENINNH